MTFASSTPEELSRHEGRVLAGRFRLTRLIDQGGFGAVYEGVDEKLVDQPIAVKMASATVSESAFFREAKLAAKFGKGHRNVVRVRDYGVDEGIPFIVMDLLRGPNLQATLEQLEGRPFPPEQLCKFVREVGSALENAHRGRLVHRDLKPKNIILVDQGVTDMDGSPLERFVLFDFGIAAQTDAINSLANRTMAGAGTPEYMSPEQVQARETTPQSDIYSFGVILYQLVAGRVPFPLESKSQLGVADCFRAIVDQDPPRPSEHAPDRSIPSEVEDLILQCLEKDPAARPASMREVCQRFLEVYEPRPRAEPSSDAFAGTLPPPGAEGSGSRSGTDTSGAASGETRPWAPTTAPGSPRWVGPVALLFGALALCGGLAAYMGWLKPTGPTPAWTLNLPAEATLVAGKPASIPLTVERTAFEEPIHLELEAPEGVTVERDSEGPVESGTRCVLRVGLNTFPWRDLPVTRTVLVTANAGEKTREHELNLVIESPEIWPPEGALPGNWRREGSLYLEDGQVYAERLVRMFDDSEVPFRLVPEQRAAGGNSYCFYVMETEVWNALFARFAQDAPENVELSRLELDEGEKPRLPVTKVLPGEAVHFARWLGGDRGHLPTRRQWNAAAGYYDWTNDRFQQRPRDWIFWDRWQWPKGPFLGELPFVQGEIAADPAPFDEDRPSSPLPVGTAARDVSPYGCRDMGGNVVEWTRPPHRPLDGAAIENAPIADYPEYEFDAKGGRFTTEPVVFEHWQDDRTSARKPGDERFSYIGFRAVLEPRTAE